MLGDNEFRTVFGGIGDFGDWDQNGDGALLPNEAYSGLYATWNRNRGPGITCREFDQKWAQQYAGLPAAPGT